MEAVRHLTELSDIVFCGDGEDTFSPGAMVTQIKSKIRNIVQSNISTLLNLQIPYNNN